MDAVSSMIRDAHPVLFSRDRWRDGDIAVRRLSRPMELQEPSRFQLEVDMETRRIHRDASDGQQPVTGHRIRLRIADNQGVRYLLSRRAGRICEAIGQHV